MERLDVVLKQFDKEWENLKSQHSNYIDCLENTKSTQSACVQSAKHCKSYVQYLAKELEKMEKVSNENDKAYLELIRMDIQRKELLLRDVEEMLPRSPGVYLRIVLGALNISFLNKQDKFAYKSDYEQFKIVVSTISAVMAFILYFFVQHSLKFCAISFIQDGRHQLVQGDEDFHPHGLASPTDPRHLQSGSSFGC
ncbi:Transmembrane protein 120B [Fasciola hepatica]|uniref:Transmembrane protein 120B n=1 Tax=Fasciola hepatica TaxID=6192 RepID=A0A4E0QTQ8_FASHE|nr:Transmembrane protein 120B [Fasciola hepatica]